MIKAPFDQWWRAFEQRSFPGVDATFIHAFDDPNVMAGNGTIGLELIEDLPDVDAVIVPWGGGGLACGIASVVKALRPSVRVYAAGSLHRRPSGCASLKAGTPQTVDYTPSFVDGIGSKTVFPGMFNQAQQLLDGSNYLNPGRNRLRAKTRSRAQPGVIAEGAAIPRAVAAALKSGPGKIVAIISGGNIDLKKIRPTWCLCKNTRACEKLATARYHPEARSANTRKKRSPLRRRVDSAGCPQFFVFLPLPVWRAPPGRAASTVVFVGRRAHALPPIAAKTSGAGSRPALRSMFSRVSTCPLNTSNSSHPPPPEPS